MGNVIGFPLAGTNAEPDRSPELPPHMVGLLLGLVRSTAHALNRPRNEIYFEVTHHFGLDDLRYVPVTHIKRIVSYMHTRQMRQIDTLTRMRTNKNPPGQ